VAVPPGMRGFYAIARSNVNANGRRPKLAIMEPPQGPDTKNK